MKIRSKLIIAFLIMTIFPTLLMLLCISIIFEQQTNTLEDTFGVKNASISSYELMLNPVNFFHKITYSDYKYFKEKISGKPDSFKDSSYIHSLEEELKNTKTYLVATCDGQITYVGNLKKFEKLSSLPISVHNSEISSLAYLDQKTSSVIREISFDFSDKQRGQIFMITDCSSIKSQWKFSLQQLCMAFILIIIITTISLVMWLYQSILRPINLLRFATMQIGSGELDKPISITSADEIGELCHDFEEMRLRLQRMVNQGIQSEENTREIMSSISHDLKTPITAIKGYTEGILDGVADTPEKQAKYLQTIYAKANDMTYLIDELSVFSKVEQNSLAYNFISVNLNDYFTDCIEEFSLDLESKDFQLDFINDVDTDTQVIADPEQLKRVLHNLIGNAVKYSKKTGGHITIQITDVPRKTVEPPLYRQLNEDGTDMYPIPSPDEFVQIQIEDNGLGIAAKDLPHIFDRFFRADASRNSSKRGSGLGLAIVKMIISDHGGDVWAESIEGVGSSFYFTLKKDLQTNGGAYEQNIDY